MPLWSLKKKRLLLFCLLNTAEIKFGDIESQVKGLSPVTAIIAVRWGDFRKGHTKMIEEHLSLLPANAAPAREERARKMLEDSQ